MQVKHRSANVMRKTNDAVNRTSLREERARNMTDDGTMYA